MSATPVEFSHPGLRIIGFSAAGEESYYVLPEMDLSFEFGRCPREVLSVNHVFLSHGHMDHAAGAAYYFAQRMFIDNSPGTLYLHEKLIEPMQRLLAVWGEIDGGCPPANFVAIEPGRDIVLRRDLTVRPFAVRHPFRSRERGVIPAMGYALIDTRQKLHEEYASLTGPQLVELKKQGVSITHTVEVPLLAYCGDTAPGDFLHLDCVRKAKVLLLECTFLEPDHVSRARAGAHMHVRDLREILPSLQNEKILLTHVTRRTLPHDARRLLEKELGPTIDDRVSFFMDAPRKRRHPRRPAE